MNLDKYFQDYKPSDNQKHIKKSIGRPRSNPNRTIPKKQLGTYKGKMTTIDNIEILESINNFKKIAYQMQKEQKFIVDKVLKDSDTSIYEIGVSTGIDRILRLMERQL